jgi:Tol biopolymer transport system component
MTSGLLLMTACGARLSGNPAEVVGPDATVADDAAMPDMTSDAMQLLAWSTPAKVGPAATAAVEDDVTLSSDALEMIFAVVTANGNGKDLYYTSRAAIGAAWTTPAVSLPFNTPGSSEEAPRFSGDNRTLYFASDRVTAGNLDIYSVTRQAAGNATWGKPALVSGVNTSATEKWFAPCTGGHYVVVRSTGTGTGGTTHLFEGMTGSAPAAITSLNSPTASDTGAFLTQDCLTIYFASFRTTPEKIFTAHRAAVGDAWPPPTPVDDFKLTGTDNQEDPWLSPDGKTFALASNAPGNGNKDIYLSTR